MFWCESKDKLCAYDDIEKRGRFKLDWNGKVDPLNLDKPHLCPRQLKTAKCPSGAKKLQLKVCEKPGTLCAYARGELTSVWGKNTCAKRLMNGKCPKQKNEPRSHL